MQQFLCSAGVKGWRVVVFSQPAVRSRERECVALRACILFLPSPEETAASGTSPENSDGATFPQTPLETHNHEVYARM